MEDRVGPADSLQKAGEAGSRTADGRFAQGRSGNPAGRQRRSKNRATLSAQSLLEGQAEALTGKAVELALGGDMTALRFCPSRIAAPRRESAGLGSIRADMAAIPLRIDRIEIRLDLVSAPIA